MHDNRGEAMFQALADSNNLKLANAFSVKT
jgi:hypothetical protein